MRLMPPTGWKPALLTSEPLQLSCAEQHAELEEQEIPRIRAATICLSLGLVLLALEVWGELRQAGRHPAALAASDRGGPVLSPEEVVARLREAEALVDFEARLRAVTSAFAGGIVHYWPEHGPPDPLLWPSPAEDWPLHVVARLTAMSGVEALDWRAAVRRGVGFCSQAALAVADYLGEQGVPANMVELDGHVVAAATAPNGRTYLLDADYDVLLPFGLETAEREPARVADAYQVASVPAAEAARIAGIYGPAGNGATSVFWYRPKLHVVALVSTWLVWLIPLALVGAGLALRRRTRTIASLQAHHLDGQPSNLTR
jgi:hypothetical protein